MKLLCALCLVLSASLSSIAFAGNDVIVVNAKINDPVTSNERALKYEEPLDAALKEAKLGEVTGGGNSVGKQGKIEWAGVDIEVTDVKKSIPLIKAKLLELGAPKGSTLEYRVGDRKVVVSIQK